MARVRFPNTRPGCEGYLGNQCDAFKTHFTNSQIPDVIARVNDQRSRRRLDDLQVVERTFVRGRLVGLERWRTLHLATMEQVRQMMSSEQFQVFDVNLNREVMQLRSSLSRRRPPIRCGCPLHQARVGRLGHPRQ